jgi:hypothetical protein
MTLSRVNDRTAIAFVNQGDALWITNDGRTWTALAQPSGLKVYGGVVTDGRHAIVIGSTHTNPSNAWNVTDVSLVNDDGTLVNLAQSGATPPYSSTVQDEQWVVGPTGILVTDGSNLWIGLPS